MRKALSPDREARASRLLRESELTIGNIARIMSCSAVVISNLNKTRKIRIYDKTASSGRKWSVNGTVVDLRV